MEEPQRTVKTNPAKGPECDWHVTLELAEAEDQPVSRSPDSPSSGLPSGFPLSALICLAGKSFIQGQRPFLKSPYVL